MKSLYKFPFCIPSLNSPWCFIRAFHTLKTFVIMFLHGATISIVLIFYDAINWSRFTSKILSRQFLYRPLQPRFKSLISRAEGVFSKPTSWSLVPSRRSIRPRFRIYDRQDITTHLCYTNTRIHPNTDRFIHMYGYT